MNDQEDQAPGTEPGWFKDPRGEAAERLWDGMKWTDEVRGLPPQEEVPQEPEQPLSESQPTPALATNEGGAMRRSIRKRPVLWVIATGSIALVIGVGIGGSDTTELDQKNEEIRNLKSELAAAEGVADAAAEEQERLSKEEMRLDKREASIEEAEATQKRNTIPDGIWKVGTDFDAGTYRAEGGSTCYWALLDSADTSDIINNGGFSANQTLTIDSPWFETNGCGEWTKIG